MIYISTQNPIYDVNCKMAKPTIKCTISMLLTFDGTIFI